MKYMLIVLITMGSPIIGEDKKTFELRIPQESKEECEKSAKTFKFHPQKEIVFLEEFWRNLKNFLSTLNL